MDVRHLRSQFPVLARVTYLNAGSCGPVPEAARQAAVAAWTAASETGRAGAYYQQVLEAGAGLRARYAALLGAADADVALTAGTSDGVGRVVGGLPLGPGDEILTADDEHPGLQGPLGAARRNHGVTLRAVPLADLPGAVSPATKLVACSHVSWSSGELAPVADLVAAAGDVPILLDGAQGVGAVPVDVEALGVAFYAGSGQKWLCGPVGSGMLWVHPAWTEQLTVVAPTYGNLEVAGDGLDAELATGAKRFDTPSQDLATTAAAGAALDVLDEPGWEVVHDRAATLAGRLADALRDAGREVVDRGPSTLVAWSAGSDEAAVATRERLAADGIVIRDLPGTGRVRASVGAWNDDADLERLLAAL